MRSPDVLKRMKRPGAQQKTLDRIHRWREICPDLAVALDLHRRLSRRDRRRFRDVLLDWLDEAQLDRVGCFKYEPVDGATSNALDGAVPQEVKEERWHRFMKKQQAISARRQKRKVGTRHAGLDRRDRRHRAARAAPRPTRRRSTAAVHVMSRRPLRVGEFAQVKIDRADEYDLYGTVVGF